MTFEEDIKEAVILMPKITKKQWKEYFNRVMSDKKLSKFTKQIAIKNLLFLKRGKTK